jgi:hypothetical protein
VPCTVVQAWPPRIGSPHSGQRRSAHFARDVICSCTRAIIAARSAVVCARGEAGCLESIDMRIPYPSCLVALFADVLNLVVLRCSAPVVVSPFEERYRLTGTSWTARASSRAPLRFIVPEIRRPHSRLGARSAPR